MLNDEGISQLDSPAKKTTVFLRNSPRISASTNGVPRRQNRFLIYLIPCEVVDFMYVSGEAHPLLAIPDRYQ
jgi:hypothetical protein